MRTNTKTSTGFGASRGTCICDGCNRWCGLKMQTGDVTMIDEREFGMVQCCVGVVSGKRVVKNGLYLIQ